MLWFPSRRRTIGSRIFLGYTVITVLALGFMVIIASLLLAANARQIEALERRQRLETNAQRLVLALRQEESSVRGFLLAGNDEYLTPYREGILLHQAALDELDQLALTPADQAALEEVRTRYIRFLIEANRQIAAYREESKERSIALWETTGRASTAALEAAIADFVQLHRQAIDVIVVEAQGRRDSVTLLMIGLMVIAGLSVVLSGRRLARSITEPVGRLVEVAAAFSAGDFDRRAPTQTRDELATLARVMNEMATNLAHSRRAVQASLRQTEERNRQLTALNSLAGTLSQSLDLRHILEWALEHVLVITGTRRGWVWLLDDDHLADAPVVMRQITAGELAEMQLAPRREYLQAVARLGEVISKDQASPLRHGTPPGGPTGRSLLAPLATHDRTLGLMALIDDEAQPEAAANLELIQALGRQIAVGIENARLFAVEQRLTREALALADTARLVSGALELDQILPIIAESGVALLGVDRSLILLFDDYRRGRPGIYHHGLTAADVQVLQEHAQQVEAVALQNAMTDDGVLSIPDVEAETRPDLRAIWSGLRSRSVLVVALQARGRPLGVLAFDTLSRRRAFSADDQRVAVALADQAAVSVESALLYAGVQERARQLAGLYEIGKVISATLNLAELCEVLYRETQQLMDVDAFKVSLYNPAEQIQRLIFRIEAGQRHPAETLPGGAGLTGHVIQTRQSLRTSRAEVEALGVTLLDSLDAERPTPSILAVPLAREERVLGVIVTQSYREQAYSAQDQEVFEAIANQAAIAIENGQLQRQALDLAVVEERNRLARDLHDSVTQMLFSITLTLQAGRVLLQRNPAQAESQIDKAQQTAQEALAEMRALIYQLRPASLRERGLVGALSSYLEAYQRRTGLAVTFQHEGEATLTEAQEQALFRITQEALNNIDKHAQAGQVQVGLMLANDSIGLTVRDDGVGLAERPASSAPTWGITGMRERAEVLGGSLVVESAEGGGTVVQARLPVTMATPVTAGISTKEVGGWSQSG